MLIFTEELKESFLDKIFLLDGYYNKQKAKLLSESNTPCLLNISRTTINGKEICYTNMNFHSKNGKQTISYNIIVLALNEIAFLKKLYNKTSRLEITNVTDKSLDLSMNVKLIYFDTKLKLDEPCALVKLEFVEV